MLRLGFLLAALGLAGCGALQMPEIPEADRPARAPERSPPPIVSNLDVPKIESPSVDVAPTPPPQASTSLGEEISECLVANYNELADALAEVRDAASARDAAAKVGPLVRRQVDLRQRVIDMSRNLTAEQDDDLQSRFGEQIRNAAGRVIEESKRIKKIPGTAPVLAAMVTAATAP